MDQIQDLQDVTATGLIQTVCSNVEVGPQYLLKYHPQLPFFLLVHVRNLVHTVRRIVEIRALTLPQPLGSDLVYENPTTCAS